MSPRSPVWGFSPAVVFCLHLAATLAMTGIIWFIQIVHYPLYDHVPAAAFAGYEAAHTRLIVWIVIPLMAVETMTGLLLWWRRPAAVPRALIVIGLGLLGIIWFSTAVFQIPQHLRLAHGFDPSASLGWLSRL